MTTRIDIEGDAAIDRIADCHGFSAEAVRLMQTAVSRGHGAMAQFDHPEFGGLGQWMRDGMVMLSAPGDDQLKARVEALCKDLVELDARPSSERDHPLAETEGHAGPRRIS